MRCPDSFRILVFLAVTLAFGCNSIPKGYKAVNGKAGTEIQATCSDVYAKINKHWAMHEDIHCYYYNKKLIKAVMESEGCFVGRDTSEIIALFGKPNKNEKYVLKYNLSINCKKGYDFMADYYLRFYIDFNNNPNIISSIQFGKVEVQY